MDARHVPHIIHRYHQGVHHGISKGIRRLSFGTLLTWLAFMTFGFVALKVIKSPFAGFQCIQMHKPLGYRYFNLPRATFDNPNPPSASGRKLTSETPRRKRDIFTTLVAAHKPACEACSVRRFQRADGADFISKSCVLLNCHASGPSFDRRLPTSREHVFDRNAATAPFQRG